jgi:hypothetical protein
MKKNHIPQRNNISLLNKSFVDSYHITIDADHQDNFEYSQIVLYHFDLGRYRRFGAFFHELQSLVGFSLNHLWQSTQLALDRLKRYSINYDITREWKKISSPFRRCHKIPERAFLNVSTERIW